MICPASAKSQEAEVFICVGSNLGDKKTNCKEGLGRLTQGVETRMAGLSRFYRTEPVDYADQDWFVNVVAKVVTCLAPAALLRRLKEIETELGRVAGGIRFGPRVLDMDIIFYADRVLETRDLIIPHPRMHKRHFVLKPICDIDPAIVHPVLNRSVGDLLDDLDVTGQALRIIP